MTSTTVRLLSRALTAVSLGVVVAASAGCGGHSTAPDQARPPIDVRVARARMTDLSDRLEAGGTVQARITATLASRLMAPVSAVLVRPGDKVRAGQRLVSLDGRDLAARARQARTAVAAGEQGARAAASEREAAEAALALAEASHRRIRGLHERKSATDQELDEAEAALRAARARATGAVARASEAESALASARAGAEASTVLESYADLVAPFDGVVTEKLIEPGNMAAPGMPLLRLDATGGFRVDVRLDESRAAWLSPGRQVDVILPAGGAGDRTVTGSVIEVARAVEADARAFLVKIGLDDPGDLRTGTFARVQFDGPSRQGLVVPSAAVVKRGQVATVFVAEKGVARLRLVRTGAVTREGTEILAGLDEGELVVVSPPPGLSDEQPVKALDTPSAESTSSGARQ